MTARKMLFGIAVFLRRRAKVKRQSWRSMVGKLAVPGGWQGSAGFLGRLARLSCLVVLLAFGGRPAGAETVQIKKVVHLYALTSANDYPARDPQDWRLLASNDGGATWTTLDVRTNEVFQSRYERKLCQTTNETAYEIYRLQIDRVHDPVNEHSVQLAELEVMGQTEADHEPEPGFSDVLSAQGENPRAETVACLFDGRVETKWLDFSSSPLRASWVQWQYAAPVKKVVRQYALTSANDFPQRDPQDWHLLGSNDGGKTWSTLDVRTGEVFTERQQRKLYLTTNETAFSTYRLLIDRVRDARSAVSVQLAELELMGQTEDDSGPEPIFTDLLSAQGDNPSAETVARLFDGRAETKWLDFSSNYLTQSSWIQWQYAPPVQTVVTNISELLALRARANDGYQVRIEAVVVGPLARGKQMSFMDATGCIELGGIGGTESLGAGRRVLITGISEWADRKVGVKSGHAGVLCPLPVADSGRWAGAPSLSQGEDLKWMEVEGEIQYQHWTPSEFAFDLVGESVNLRVHVRAPGQASSLFPAGTRVLVRGLCSGAFNEKGQWVASELWAAGEDSLSRLDSGVHDPSPAALPAPAKPDPVDLKTLTKIEQIRRLTDGQIRNHPHVKIRGIVTGLVGGFIQDDTAGIEVVFPSELSRKFTAIGTYIEVEGTAELADFGTRLVSAGRVENLGRGKLPQPQRLPLSQLMSGQFDGQWVEMEGMVRSTDGSHVLIICDGRELMVTVGQSPVGRVRQLVDAEVRVRGVCVAAMDDNGRVQGMHLLIPSLDDVEVVEPPSDPVTLPVRPIGSLLGLSGPREFIHRVKVEGVVTLQENQKVFLQDDSGSTMAIFKENVVLDANFRRARWLYWRTAGTSATVQTDDPFRPGTRVQVVGFPETYRYSPVLTEVTVTKVGDGQPIKPVELTVNGIQEGGMDSTLVSLNGVLRGATTIGSTMILALEWQDRTLQVLVPDQTEESPQFSLGSRLRVTGVCQVDPAPYPELGLGVGSIRIQTRSAADVTVLARPSWWTVRRAVTLMGGMALATIAALVWIKELRRQVKERTVQLSAEIQLREQTERNRALEQERARIAKDLHDDLGANLTQIVFLSERVEVARHDGHDVARWFDLIPATARRTIQSLDEIVWAVNPQHDSLESLANYISQFAQEHLTLAGVRCVLDVPMVLPSVPLSAEIRHNLLLTTREALQNAVTHAMATEVQLTLKLNDQGLNITIADNGRGFDQYAASLNGNGLQNMRRRLEAVGGQLEITSRPGAGTSVNLFVPQTLLHGRVIGSDPVSVQAL